MSVTVEAPAKINLTLDVVGRRGDGYHLIESVMQAIDLCDRITVRPIDAPGSAVLTCRDAVSYTHLRAHETGRKIECRLLL